MGLLNLADGSRLLHVYGFSLAAYQSHSIVQNFLQNIQETYPGGSSLYGILMFFYLPCLKIIKLAKRFGYFTKKSGGVAATTTGEGARLEGNQ